MTNNDIKELTDFLDKYHVEYEVVGDRVVADRVMLANRSISKLPYSFGNLTCRYLSLHHNPLTSEAIELLEKLQSNGVFVNYQPTKQTNNGCKIMTINPRKNMNF